jgi:SAM-dependent methyltransferase
MNRQASAPEPERFEADWLTLREPVDHRSRAHRLAETLAAWWVEAAQGRGTEVARVVDLGCGTGSNLRYLSRRIPSRQSWTLIDHDPDLLRRVAAPSASGLRVTEVHADLEEAVGLHVPAADLVTASALLDLASEPWLVELAETAARAEAAALLALTYDGSIRWSSHDPDDQGVRDSVNAHQRRNKGLGAGAALGPVAGSVAEAAFRRLGYRTTLAPSPWRLGPDDASLTLQLIDGWLQAAVEEEPADRERWAAWANRRRASIAREDFELVVGHVDLLALPAR